MRLGLAPAPGRSQIVAFENTSYGANGLVQKRAQAPHRRTGQAGDSSRRLGEMRRVRAHRHQGPLRPGPERLPELRASPPHQRAGVHRLAGGRRLVARARRHAPVRRSPQLRELPGPPGGRREEGRAARGAPQRVRPAGRDGDRPRCDGLQLHGRLDGVGRRREARPADAPLGREEDRARRRLGVGRGPHAGGGAVPDADGQDVRRGRPAARGARALHLNPHQPDHRRGVGVLRDAGGRHPGRAGGGDRVRGAAGDQADDWAGPARGLPDGRIPARARDCGRRGAAERAAGHHRSAAAAHGRPATGGGRRLTRVGLSFEDACRFLFARQGSRIKWSLGPTDGLLDVLGHPERHFPCVHVAGTNGKGSTCAFTAAALAARGFRVGVYTSPHLVSVRERVVVDGVPISEDAFAEWASLLEPHIERLGASFFEATTAIAFADLAARGVDIAVIEVGLGGRLDSTNVITPLVAVVTKIAREHTDYLGNDLASIAREKAGIAKRAVPFVTGELDPAVRQVLVAEAERRGAQPLIPVDARGAPTRPLGLKGRHQHANAWVALGALNALAPPFGPVGDEWPDSFAHAYVPARFDVRGRWIFDVAHNPDGARVLADTLREYDPPHPRRALVGVLGDKDYLGMIDCLTPEVDSFVFTMPDTAPERRRWDLGRLERELGHLAVAHELEPQFERALERAQDDAATVIVTGSFHTVGDALARLPGFAPVG